MTVRLNEMVESYLDEEAQKCALSLNLSIDKTYTDRRGKFGIDSRPFQSCAYKAGCLSEVKVSGLYEKA